MTFSYAPSKMCGPIGKLTLVLSIFIMKNQSTHFSPLDSNSGSPGDSQVLPSLKNHSSSSPTSHP